MRRDRCEPMAMGPCVIYWMLLILVILVLDPGIRKTKMSIGTNLPNLKQGRLPLCQRTIDLIAEKDWRLAREIPIR